MYKLVEIRRQYSVAEKAYSELQKNATTRADQRTGAEEAKEGSSEGVSSEGETVENTGKPPITVDFEALGSVNPDIIGWIYIPAVEISYPIMKGADNASYLYRTFDGYENSSGSIFMEEANKEDFLDPHTILYGHSMKNGTMFGKLKSFLNEPATYDRSPYFWILTPGRTDRYRIFSYYETEVESETYTLFSEQGSDFTLWCASMRALSMRDTGELAVDESTRVVTLSTCAADLNRGRRVVQGILDNDI